MEGALKQWHRVSAMAGLNVKKNGAGSCVCGNRKCEKDCSRDGIVLRSRISVVSLEGRGRPYARTVN